jgi:methionyl-tRNA formyltransferase
MLRIIFMGTAELACASLEALSQANDMQVVAVVTQPDRPKGRDLKLQPSAVKELALKKNLPVLQPEKARHESFVQTLRELKPDLIVVAAYGQILPQAMLDIPRFGCLNVHTSILPKYRGAAPIQWAIWNGDAETGVTIMKMDAGLDTGDMLSCVETPILETDDAQILHDRLAQLGAQALMEVIPRFVSGKVTPQKQPEGQTYARKISKEDGRLDWSKPARALWNQMRAFTPWPGAFTFQAAEPKPRLLKIWKVEFVPDLSGKAGEILRSDKHGIVVACGQDALRILSLQREGGKRMTAQEFIAGSDIKAGDVLG